MPNHIVKYIMVHSRRGQVIEFGPKIYKTVKLTVRLLDGNLEIGAHVGGNLCYLIYLRHLIGSKRVTHRVSL